MENCMIEQGAYLMERIRAKCVEDGDCLIWTGATTSNGTPTMRMPKTREMIGVRRLVLKIAGRWKEGLLATSTCGHPQCVCEHHARGVTRAQLSKLAIKRTAYHLSPARNAKIAAAARARYGKLTPEMREAIMESDLPQRVLGEMYGVGQHSISELKQGKSYRDYANPFAGLGAR